jgi:archaellum component FlaC
MTSIHVSLKGTAASGAGSPSAAGGSRSELEALQKKMTGLVKQLKDASQDTSPGAKKRLEMLQLAIEACQMQIEQLMHAEAQKAAKKAEVAAPAAAGRSATDMLGTQIDTQA